MPVGEDIGFLPGTEEEKMGPWMGAFDDNLEALNKSDSDPGEWGRAATQGLIRSRVKIKSLKSLNFMRDRQDTAKSEDKKDGVMGLLLVVDVLPCFPCLPWTKQLTLTLLLSPPGVFVDCA